ncbi:hypothetical protein A3D42_03345 [Candidatus Nomurabacteria bacterium RIFCSPHIGHO2_02_FULL_41_18]|uniref:Ribosome-binding factor A n=1 Tax=Candidatus Nomurabacteria bacterium RIFCSPHIGHO2_02_FULL_41_18 TaxID=1801754 RepID=A0A1F6W7J2_9BACT|nr:MAG: hypothetical protein A2737_00175 [Candidatus Nomurabacteria bacterium RIFCSPHIGHO2_01_FULL_41_71]OGI77920.1 MAG: hypothetical protein A3D42_03345 [Candidatus Nomurabacteria bacterium RIFCSPHIGHO2_02_FULL_41_18]OGI90335.1 MAG: hypothetical protein A3B01_01260 [Candidatus Nomurabacteria bacterium RIFCSPLOWO2_01_FULL_41_52b]
MAQRNEKVTKLIKEISAEFLSRESSRASLISVSGTSISPDLRRATVFITVFPENKEKTALLFVKRKRRELRELLKKRLTIKTIPFIEIEIDRGEKNRQKIDELLRSK